MLRPLTARCTERFELETEKVHMTDSSHPLVLKDVNGSQPIPGVWRPVLREVVRAFALGDFALSHGVVSVERIDDRTAHQIRRCLSEYGATLTELPDETWRTSVAQWYGQHWDFLVDLWTLEEGRSDLVLSGRVTEAGHGYEFKVHLVYVP